MKVAKKILGLFLMLESKLRWLVLVEYLIILVVFVQGFWGVFSVQKV